MIRAAKKEDLGELVRMGRDFAGAAVRIPFDEESFVKTMIALMADQTKALWVIDVGGKVRGMLGAVVFPCWYNFHHQVAQELQWWVDQGYRGREIILLLDRFLEWADEVGAAQVLMGRRMQIESKGLARFYERRGFVENEMGYVKHLRG